MQQIVLKVRSVCTPERSELFWRVGLLLLLVFALALVLSLYASITDRPAADDGRQNLKLAYNLAYHGVYSNSDDPDEHLEPSNIREPVPILSLAAWIRLHPKLSSGHSLETINSGSSILAVKRFNLFWSFLCLAGTAAAVLAAVRPRFVAVPAAAAAIWLTYEYFLQQPLVINRAYTEVHGGALLALLSFSLIRALEKKSRSWFVFTGLAAGLLALTKAVFLYVSIGMILTLFVVYMIRQDRAFRLRFLGLLALTAGCMAAVILPWILRNRLLLGTTSISSRGGTVLYARAVKNQMNDTEFAGAFYHYAPPALKAYIGNYLGFNEDDLEAGGVLQRINRDGASSFGPSDLEAEQAGRPEDAISFYRSARAERFRLEMEYEAQGVEDPTLLASAVLQDRAVEMILADPVSHLKTTLVFLWRGMWVVNVRFRYLVLGYASLWFAGGWGLLRRKDWMIGISLPSLGVMAFHALFTHYIPRYSMILVPMLMAVLVVVIARVIVGAGSRAIRSEAGAGPEVETGRG